MDNIQRLILQYKDKIKNIGQKSIFDIYNAWIKKEFAEPASTAETENAKRIAYIELLNSDRFKNSNKQKENLLFKCFVLKNEGAGKDYYQLPCSRRAESDKIYAIMEEKTGYVSGNCTKLVLELMLERGIKESDYKENTIALIEYLSRIEAFDKGWY